MGNVDFGILQTAPVAHPMQVIQTPNAAMENSQSVLQGLNAGTNAASQIQQMNINRQMLPGQLAQQAATLAQTQAVTKGQTLQNTSVQRDVIYHQNADAAFTQAKQQGASNEQAMDAYQSHLKPEDAENMQLTRDTHMKNVVDNNATAVSNAAGIVAQTHQEILAANDPKQVQHLLDNANRQLDRIDPNHMPIKSIQDLHDYGIAAMGTLMNPLTQAKLQFELNKAQVTAQANATGAISTDAIKNANTQAAGAQQIVATQAAYDSTLNDIQKWNQQHPDMAVTTGPGTQTWMSLKQKIAAIGGPVEMLDKMEKLQANRDALVSQTLQNLKTIPRNEKVISSFTNALSNPSDTTGAQQVKSRLVSYGAQQQISYADFLAEYRDANNGSTTGAQRQWANFLANDPSIQTGGLPDPDYVKTSDDYLKYTNKNYSPSKEDLKKAQEDYAQKQQLAQMKTNQAPTNQPQSNPTTPQSNKTAVMDGTTYTFINGKWYK